MLESIFEQTTCERLRRELVGKHLDGFVDHLLALGFARHSIRCYIGPAIHFGAWLGRHDAVLREVDDSVVSRFRAHLRRCRCRRRSYVRQCGRSLECIAPAVNWFIRYMRARGVVPTERTAAVPRIVSEYETWMRQHRGSAPRTLADYRRCVVAFVEAQQGRSWRRLNAKTIRSYVVERRRETTPVQMLLLVRSLRMFVRFLVATGRCPSHLDRAVPSVPRWRLATLPKYLSPKDVERVLVACRSRTVMGLRDRAILLLLARLALRAGEVRALRLADVDWGSGRVRVVGKLRRPAWLPLPQEVGDAILAYLRRRPTCDVPEIFVCTSAPFRSLGSNGVCGIARRAIDRAGVSAESRGAHVFRHSAATALVRGGVSLDDVGRLLRHTSRDSTAIYAKVDRTSLLRIAQPWPGVAS
jgi:integrase/recombinase XerD